jgi:D-aspartate ligase
MSASTRNDFVPVLLGTEIAGYGMARAFYEEFGSTSVVYGTFGLTPTANSKFIEVRVVPDLLEGDKLVEVLNEAADGFAATPVLVPCGDDYAVALSNKLDKLSPRYRVVCAPADVVERVSDKENFYQLCEQRHVPYPKTHVVSGPEVGELPFGFPVALKPSDGPAYRAHPFEGQKKAYVLSSMDELEETLRRVYAAGYAGHMIIQDFIPGDDRNMRVVNGYVREDGTVTMMSLGHPLLEDYSPMAIGNYATILSYADDTIYDTVESLMSHSGYRGFFNIDMKYDPRDGSYRLFEVNPRAGRSSFFSTLAGYNLARYAVDDVLDGGKLAPVRGTNEVLWYGVPKCVVKKYVEEGPEKKRALELIAEGKCGTTVFGAHDNNPKRVWNMSKLWVHYVLDYRKYFGKRELD